MQNLLDDLKAALATDPELAPDGELLKNLVIERAAKLDASLLKRLLGSDTLRRHFFQEVDGVQVFDKVRFQEFVANKAFLPDSYTAFANRIGLHDGEGYLRERSEVVLAWPYKDCVLEGGQTKEDARCDEVFWNATLAPDDITRLFEPKVLTHFARWDAEAVRKGKPKPVGRIDAEVDNLLIKGNNLLVLHSLKRRYAGQAKLIYIDPPYNTDSDTFGYNDRFNHSSWLTFMKNRLEVAKDLLHPDGSIYVNIDYNEAHYLKVLMDEIFGPENFQREIIWRIGWVSGYKAAANNYIRNHDTILFYSKNPKSFTFHKRYIPRSEYIARFDAMELKQLRQRLAELGVSRSEADAFLSEAQEMGLPDRYPVEDTWNASIYDKLNSIAVVSFSGESVSKLLGVDDLKGQKAEALLYRIMDQSTDEDDLVLDFFAGTGTTLAVATKLGRRWIGVEQMRYAESTTSERLKNVLDGDGVGISTKVGWTGGGSFVYAEVAEWNEGLGREIKKASDNAALKAIARRLSKSGYVRHEVQFDEIMQDHFATLPLKEQKRALLESLDANHLYVNYGDMADEAYGISAADQAVNRAFYEGEG